MDTAPSIIVTMQNIKGLHARAAAKFVKTVEQHQADVIVYRVEAGHTAEAEEFDGPINGTSLLGLMMLAADKGTKLQLTATGVQATQVLDALQRLIDEKFGEE